MSIPPFRLERYFAQYEFKAKYLLSASDCEALSMDELLGMASPDSRALWNELKLAYTESAGHPLLRAEVTGLYRHISAEQVVIAAPEEAIYIAMHTLLSPGDHVIALAPVYQSLYEVARTIGCTVTPLNLAPTPGGWTLDLAQLERSLTAQTRLLVINFPNNPTGFMPTRPQLDTLIDFARAHDLLIFSDEMYRLLDYAPAAQLPSVCDLYERGIALSGLSKTFALPGLRIGWLATQMPGLPERLLTYKDYTTICNSAPGEILGIIALQNKAAIIQRNIAIIQSNVRLAERFFGAYPQHFEWLPPQAGSVAFPRWIGPGSVEQFCQGVLDQQGVMVVPGGLFDYPGSHFRVGLGRSNFAEALEQVGQYLNY